MSSLVALVTFHCQSGQTETLALSYAVGAVQGRALVRLRRVADAPSAADRSAGAPDRSAGASAPAETNEEVRRMLKEYVVPTEADVLGANAIAIAPPPGSAPTAPEWAPYLALLARLGSEGRLTNKVGAIVDAGDPATVAAFSGALLSAGLVVVPPEPGASRAVPAAATAHGRRVAEAARALGT